MNKVILSRKGFDSSTGGKPSVVYDGKMISIPIPEADSGSFYKELRFGDTNFNYLKVMKDLGIKFYSEAHVDPDIYPNIFLKQKREVKKWRGVFGQHKEAAKHLITQEIGEGDIFLFFGWFKHIKLSKKNKFSFDKKKNEKYPNGFHAIYGFLEVGESPRIIDEIKKNDWESYHPHSMNQKFYDKNNSLFIAAEESNFNFKKTFGHFNFHDKLILSKKDCGKSVWNLDKSFDKLKISFEKQKKDSDIFIDVNNFTNRWRAQEFVIEKNETLFRWVKDLINLGLAK